MVDQQTNAEVLPPRGNDADLPATEREEPRRARAIHRSNAPWHRRAVIPAVCALLLILPTLIAWLVSATSASVYEARAELLVADQPDQSANQQNIATQVTLLGSKAVLGPVAARASLPQTGLDNAVSATQVATSQVIDLAVDDHDSGRALSLAKAILKSYDSVTADATSSSAQVAFLQSRIQQLTGQLQTLATSSGGDVTTQRELLVSQISSLQSQLITAQLSNAQASSPAHVVTQPYLVSGRVSPRPLRAALGGLIGGALLSAAFIGFYLRRARILAPK